MNVSDYFVVTTVPLLVGVGFGQTDIAIAGNTLNHTDNKCKQAQRAGERNKTRRLDNFSEVFEHEALAVLKDLELIAGVLLEADRYLFNMISDEKFFVLVFSEARAVLLILRDEMSDEQTQLIVDVMLHQVFSVDGRVLGWLSFQKRRVKLRCIIFVGLMVARCADVDRRSGNILRCGK